MVRKNMVPIMKKTSDLKMVIETIADNMISQRSKAEINFRPYFKNEVYYDEPMLLWRHVDLKKLYPNSCIGDVVYVKTILDAAYDYKIKLNLQGDVIVNFCGEEVYNYAVDGENYPLLQLRKGANPVLFKVICNDSDRFEFSFMPSVRHYKMWAKDYVFHVRATLPLQSLEGEDGVAISKLYHNGEEFDGEFVYPRETDNLGTVDFNRIYKNSTGVCAYALTYAIEDTELNIKPDSQIKVFVNREERCCEKIHLKKGDEVLVKSLKEKAWGFGYNNEAKIGIPFMKSNRKNSDWLLIGAFGSGSAINVKYAPEYGIFFDKPYIDNDWNKVFWRLNEENVYLRAYMDTFFYGQWFYAIMVGCYGLLFAGKTLGKNNYIEYFKDSVGLLARYREYAKYDSKNFGQCTFLQRAIALDDLDSIGSIGMNMCELYRLMPSDDVLSLIRLLEKSIDNIPRFNDGTFHRESDMWADDTFMSCPFLIRLGLLLKDNKYFDEAARQILGFKKRLWMEDKKLFSHIYFLEDREPNNIPWGRGNGWVYITLSELLEHLPDDNEYKKQLIELYISFTQGICENQDRTGLWHQVITREDSYLETSCSGMFIIGLSRGIMNGWIDEKYKENIIKAYYGLLENKIDAQGNLYDVCIGSGNSKSEDYYVNLNAIDNDDHGTGIILQAFSLMLKMNLF